MNVDLTHPELLTIEQLQSYVKDFVESNIPSEKYELVQLFYKYVTPLPQRKFRSNRLGTILTLSQSQCSSKKRSLSGDVEDVEKSCKQKLKLASNDFNEQAHGEKHESDRGIYTIKMHNNANKNTAPIKLKRPTIAVSTNDDTETNKRIKLSNIDGSSTSES